MNDTKPANAKHDWPALKQAFLQGYGVRWHTPKAFAEQHGLPVAYIIQQAKRRGWHDATLTHRENSQRTQAIQTAEGILRLLQRTLEFGRRTLKESEHALARLKKDGGAKPTDLERLARTVDILHKNFRLALEQPDIQRQHDGVVLETFVVNPRGLPPDAETSDSSFALARARAETSRPVQDGERGAENPQDGLGTGLPPDGDSEAEVAAPVYGVVSDGDVPTGEDDRVETPEGEDS